MKDQTKSISRKLAMIGAFLVLVVITAAANVWYMGGIQALQQRNQAYAVVVNDTAPACEVSGQTWLQTSTGITFACIPADATAQTGSYWMSIHETSNAQYIGCVEAGVCKAPLQTRSATRSDYFKNEDFADYPVTAITYAQASSFCAWAGGSLPNSDQWAKAAGIDPNSEYSVDSVNPDCGKYNGPGCNKDTSAVGSYTADVSPHGVYDMAGNVREWIAKKPAENNLATAAMLQMHELRGSSWSTDHWMFSANPSGTINQASSMLAQPTWFDVGFRCVIPVE
jgi:formylglycine-generating enzyme required for sulfatase activity